MDRSPKPIIALAQGAAFGGGVGLICACDMAIAAEGASFSLSEVKLGIIPSVISPYVVAAMGQRQARRYLLTAERFDADEALRIGVVHQVVPRDQLTDAGRKLAQSLLNNGPGAIAACKELISFVARGPIDDEMIEGTAQRIARVRATDEGKEGLSAFLEKRKPNWIKD
jgi:methylglutaconyl-CoA hydratase